jgi:hypothetical protein
LNVLFHAACTIATAAATARRTRSARTLRTLNYDTRVNGRRPNQQNDQCDMEEQRDRARSAPILASHWHRGRWTTPPLRSGRCIRVAMIGGWMRLHSGMKALDEGA